MLTIWGRKNSSNVQKVLWLCTDLDITFERLDWGGPFGGNDAPAYRVMNPNGLIPTIRDGKTVVWESNTVLRYLCNTRGGEAVYPADPAKRSHVERWMDWQLSKLNTPLASLLWGYFRTPESRRDMTALARFRIEAIALWETIEMQLEDHAYIAGRDFSLADICIGVWAHRWYQYPIERPDLNQLERWYRRISERPGFAPHVAGALT
jgi:glutathione S-transferase